MLNTYLSEVLSDRRYLAFDRITRLIASHNQRNVEKMRMFKGELDVGRYKMIAIVKQTDHIS